MRTRLPGLLLIILGIVLVATSILMGEARVALVVIIPIVYGGGVLLLGGILCVLAGFFLFFYLADRVDMHGQETEEFHSERRAGGVLLIGPVPIIFGTDRKMALVAAAIGLIALALLVLLLL